MQVEQPQSSQLLQDCSVNFPVYSEWRCDMFGMNGAVVVRPLKGKEPNFFWRWMQYICFGNKWTKDKKNNV